MSQLSFWIHGRQKRQDQHVRLVLFTLINGRVGNLHGSAIEINCETTSKMSTTKVELLQTPF